MRPGPSLAGVRLVIPDRAMGLPVLRALSLCTCCRHYPGAATGRRLRSSRPAVSAFPENVVGSACTSSFSRLARRLLALRPAHSRSHLYVTSYTEGFSHFVTSMTAPVASGWSVRRVGLAPTGKAPPCHGAHVKRTLRIWRRRGHPIAWVGFLSVELCIHALIWAFRRVRGSAGSFRCGSKAGSRR